MNTDVRSKPLPVVRHAQLLGGLVRSQSHYGCTLEESRSTEEELETSSARVDGECRCTSFAFTLCALISQRS